MYVDMASTWHVVALDGRVVLRTDSDSPHPSRHPWDPLSFIGRQNTQKVTLLQRESELSTSRPVMKKTMHFENVFSQNVYNFSKMHAFGIRSTTENQFLGDFVL